MLPAHREDNVIIPETAKRHWYRYAFNVKLRINKPYDRQENEEIYVAPWLETVYNSACTHFIKQLGLMKSAHFSASPVLLAPPTLLLLLFQYSKRKVSHSNLNNIWQYFTAYHVMLVKIDINMCSLNENVWLSHLALMLLICVQIQENMYLQTVGFDR